MRRVRWEGNGRLSVLETPPDCPGLQQRARLFYRDSRGEWDPPLPVGISPPGETSRAAVTGRSIARAEPGWLLEETPEPWRL
jgi:hypothetical protein